MPSSSVAQTVFYEASHNGEMNIDKIPAEQPVF